MTSTDHIRWRCGQCRSIIEDGGGYIAVSARDIVAAAHDPSVTAAWRVRHDECDSAGGFPGFWIAVEDARVPAALMEWTQVLEARGWLGLTDWRDRVGSVADELERRAGRRAA